MPNTFAHDVGQFFLFGAHAVSAALLLHTECVNVSVIILKLLFGASDTFLGGTKIDVVLFVFIACHKKFLRFSIALETEEWCRCCRKKGMTKRPQS